MWGDGTVTVSVNRDPVAKSTSIAAVALSLREMLNRCFTQIDAADPDAFRSRPTARLVRTDDFGQIGSSANSPIRFPTLSIYCHRVDINRLTRPGWSAAASYDGQIHLPLDLHFLLTAWDSDAEAEMRILGAAMQCIEQQPALAGPLLHPLGGWDGQDAIHLVNEDLVTEDVLRTFDTLPSDFRLSVGYVARIARIDAPDDGTAPDVVTATRGIVPTTVGVA